MKKEFIKVKRYPTPDELLEKLSHILPAFRKYWQRDDNLFVNEDGKFTLHGVFSEFSVYMRQNCRNIDESKLVELFKYIEECVNTDIHSDAGVSNAACTCFLENLAGEGELSDSILNYLGEKSKEYFEKWN